MRKRNKKAILAISLATAMMAGTSFTSFAATAQDVIAKSQGSYTAGTNSVYGAKLTQDQLNAVAQAVADFKTNYVNDSIDNDAKIRAGYNYLKNNVTYIDWRESTYANTAYGALVEHKAACSGMTRAFVAMMDAVDVKAYWIHATDNSHQWNMVEFNDGFYFIDVDANIASGFEAIYKASTHPYAYDTSAYPAIGSKSGANTSGTQNAVSEGWKQDNTGWWYQNADGSYPANSWKEINGAWYYFEGNGYMASNKWIGNYYVGASGAMLTNTTTPDGYQVGADGAWIQANNNTVDTGTAGTQIGGDSTNYIKDSQILKENTARGWVNDQGEWAYKKDDGQYYRLEWARIDGKDYYFNISAHVEWELEPISTRTRTEKAIISDLEDERASGIQPGENWQSDTHGVWYKKADGSVANFFAWQSNVLGGEQNFGFSPSYIELDGQKQANVFFIRDLAACFGTYAAEYLKEYEPLRYAGPDGKVVFSIKPDGRVILNRNGSDTYSIGGKERIPQLYWDAVAQGEIPEAFQFIH